jgi:hypothetical protein
MNDEPVLLPQPRRVTHAGERLELDAQTARRVVRGSDGLSAAAWGGALRAGLDRTLAPQAYRLRVRADAVHADAGSDAGLRFALATLVQLARQYVTHLPGVEIEDEPVIARRGFMLDVSRDRVPTMAHLRDLVDRLALLKMNHLQLYTEHTFAYTDHERVWRGWSPITHAEVKELDRYCLSLGIELAANQNCFGHLSSWLRLPEYAPLAETTGEWMFLHWPRKGPFSLCPTDPKSLDFVRGLLQELLPCFSSGLVNIGCDETYDISFGRSREAVARRGRAAVYMDFVREIERSVRELGGRAMFWGDIVLSHPEIVPDIPERLIALAWGYEDDSPFDRWCGTLRSGGREAWVCPGTSSWRSITGRTSERRANIRAAARAGATHDASGFLLCDWGDTGHHQQSPLTLHALAEGAALAWNPGAEPDARGVSRHALGDDSDELAPWLDELGDCDLALRETCGELARPANAPPIGTRLRNQSALFLDMHTPLDARPEVGDPRAWEEAWRRVEALARRTPKAPHPLLAQELSHTLATAAFAAERAFKRRLPGGMSPRERAAMRERCLALANENASLWRERSREGGLEHSQGFWRAIADSFGSVPP